MQNNKQEKAPYPPVGGEEGDRRRKFRSSDITIKLLDSSLFILHSSFFPLPSLLPTGGRGKNSKYSLHSKSCQLLLNIGPVTHFR